MFNSKKYSINLESTMRDSINLMNENSAQVALVVDAENKLVGIVTDGDIRRAILKGFSLEIGVSSIMTENPVFVRQGISKNVAVELMRKKMIHHVPVLDNNNKLIDLYVLDDLLKKPTFPNSVVIMAGGKGERLKPLTNDCPKPMLQVNGVPILEIILKKCKDAGFCNFYFSVNYLKEQIVEYFDDGKKWEVNIKYLKEKDFLGTCGSLKLLPDDISDDLIVMNGDIITDLDLDRLIRFHTKTKSNMTICSRNHRVKIPFAVLNSHKEQLCSFVEKPMFNYQVNAGVYVLKKEIISYIPDQFFNMTDLIEVLLNKHKGVGVFPIHENWTDVGNPDDFNKVCLS